MQEPLLPLLSIRSLFAVASASLAILGLAYVDLAPIGQAFPAWIPWREAWVYGSGLLLLAASAGLCFSRTAVSSAFTIGAYQALWAGTNAPPIFSKPLNLGAWYGFCEALTSLAGAWILYAMLRQQLRATDMPIASERAVRAAQIVFGLTCMFYGWSHFAYAEYTASMVPSWLPSPLGFAYFTGLGHLAAGIGIVVGILPRLAAISEAIMMSLFGLMVWVPSFWAHPRPEWATPPENQWSELVVSILLAASAWMVAASLRNRPWRSSPPHSIL
ncbi:MAG TPA: DoxX family protein [Steroidobacteraceae bacterium]|nr:DoxX family protein [Steroidobacteraceae bacterium]